MTTRALSPLDRALVEIERALETVFVTTPVATQPSPAADVPDADLDAFVEALATRIVRRAYHNGLLLLECGASGIRLLPPLMIDAALVDEGLERLERSMQEAQAETR